MDSKVKHDKSSINTKGIKYVDYNRPVKSNIDQKPQNPIPVQRNFKIIIPDDDTVASSNSLKPSRKSVIIGSTAAIITVVISLIITSIVLVVTDKSVKAVKNDLSVGNYTEVVQTYNEKIKNYPVRAKIAARAVSNKVETFKKDFIYDKITYDNAFNALNILSGIDNPKLKEKISSSVESINKHNDNLKIFSEAEKLFTEKNYIDAISKFNQIQTSSGLYSDAQSRITDCCNKLLAETANANNLDTYFSHIKKLSAAKKVTDNTDIANRLTELYSGCTALVTNQANKLKQESKHDDAIALIDKTLAVYSDESLSTLRDNIENDKANAKLVIDIPKVNFIKKSGSITSKEDADTYTFEAREDGVYCLTFSEMQYEFETRVSIINRLNEEVTYDWITNGEALSKYLEKGTYKIIVQYCRNTGSYQFTIGNQKAGTNINSYNVVKDSVEFTKQENCYSFTPTVSGVYRFDFTDMIYDTEIHFVIKNHLGEPKKDTWFNGGEGCKIDLEAGEKYAIYVVQGRGLTNYTLTIGKPIHIKKIEEGKKVTGSISFTDQENRYTFTPSSSRKYTLSVDTSTWENWYLKIIDKNQVPVKLNKKNDGLYEISLTAGQTYTIYCYYKETLTDYSFTIK